MKNDVGSTTVDQPILTNYCTLPNLRYAMHHAPIDVSVGTCKRETSPGPENRVQSLPPIEDGWGMARARPETFSDVRRGLESRNIQNVAERCYCLGGWTERVRP
jgi:hypothetical protein